MADVFGFFSVISIADSWSLSKSVLQSVLLYALLQFVSKKRLASIYIRHFSFCFVISPLFKLSLSTLLFSLFPNRLLSLQFSGIYISVVT